MSQNQRPDLILEAYNAFKTSWLNLNVKPPIKKARKKILQRKKMSEKTEGGKDREIGESGSRENKRHWFQDVRATYTLLSRISQLAGPNRHSAIVELQTQSCKTAYSCNAGVASTKPLRVHDFPRAVALLQNIMKWRLRVDQTAALANIAIVYCSKSEGKCENNL